MLQNEEVLPPGARLGHRLGQYCGMALHSNYYQPLTKRDTQVIGVLRDRPIVWTDKDIII